MKITANTVTVARILLMPLPAYLLYQDIPLLYVALILIILLAVTDWLDGEMARKEGPTTLGGLLDPIADKMFLAVCFIPMAERPMPGNPAAVVFPLWMLILMFCRDFLVTSLRTSLSMRNAPMRTSLLAKYKTAIQMVAVCYLVAILIALQQNPESRFLLWVMGTSAAIPSAFALTSLLRRRKPGPRLITMSLMPSIFALLYGLLGAIAAIWILVISVTIITVLSGFSYLTDAWSALRGAPGGVRETFRFLLDGILVPTALLLPLGLFSTPGISALIMLAITLELATGGLSNLLAERRTLIRFRGIALKSGLMIGFCAGAILIFHLNLFDGIPAGELAIVGAASVAVLHAVVSFVRHRRVYLSQLSADTRPPKDRPTPLPN